MLIKKLLTYLWLMLNICVTYAMQADSCTVTIYVHGTSPGILARHKFFYSKQGLHHQKDYDQKYHKRKIAHILAQANADTYDLDHYYIFGWSGELSAKARTDAAHQLLQAIRTLRKEYHDAGIDTIKLQLITHSHGGNIVLRLPLLADADEFTIDTLILLACPIVPETANLHGHAMFKKLYAFYSTQDVIQVADKFAHARGRSFTPTANLVQSCIHVKKKPSWHLATHASFTTKTFLRHLPVVCATADTYYAQHDATSITNPPTIIIKKKSDTYTIKAV